jgi:hypothetical protein
MWATTDFFDRWSPQINAVATALLERRTMRAI